MVAHFPDIIGRKLLVPNLGFLQADDVGTVLVDHRLQLMQAGANAVDVERNDSHRGDSPDSGGSFQKERSRSRKAAP
jgi:hypothetical protein